MLLRAHQDAADINFFFEARKSSIDILYTTIFGGFPQDYDRILNFNEYWESILRDFPSGVDELVGKIIESHDDASLVPFLIADTFYSWPATIAKKYNILIVSFWTEPALVFSIDYHLDLLRANGHFPSKGVESISSKDLMSYLQAVDITTVIHQIVLKAFDQVTREEVAKKIKRLMSGETSNLLRHEMKKMRSTVQNALADDGSTQRNFDQFLKDLRDEL
ncbi:hypothetical protein BUALT_Bualt09G0078700 [Buddleja alternifolia]|uniref:Uncharacterized protein n=1 Tax=Buddleja alternifolia TaxID=168488 RepID=A0AAV6XBM6_9LAMI|nr:hypothetical protein BUALT_Bualt09G0078700 [Buddleja alternifolia]